MKRKRFSVEQIVAVLKQAELGLPVADLVRQTGISEQSFYRWKKQYAGLESTQVRELKQLSEENARLKKLVADFSLIRPSCRMSCRKSFQASAHETGCRLRDRASRLQRAAGLRFDAPESINPEKAKHSRSAPRAPTAHARDRSDADPIWLSACSSHATARRLGCRQESRSTGSIARRALFCGGNGPVGERWSCIAKRDSRRSGPTKSGASTSFTTSSAMAKKSAR